MTDKMWSEKNICNKRPMGHIAHLKNSLNPKAQLWKAMIKLIKRKNIISFLRIEWFSYVKTSSSLVKIDLMGLEKKIFQCYNQNDCYHFFP